MKSLLKSLIVVLAFFVGALVFSSLRASGQEASRHDDRKVMALESEPETIDSASSGVRRKGIMMGVWGGQHISMEVTARGAAIEYDCAHATIDRKITVDRHGRFTASGMQYPEHGGPVRRDEQGGGYAVAFKGEVHGKTMTLNVSNALTKELIGTFTLVHGAQARFMKCK